MGEIFVRSVVAAGALSLVAVVAAGCGESAGQRSTAEQADAKVQVEQVCRQVNSEIKGLPAPTDEAADEKGQRQAAQIYRTASAKLTELDTNAGLPESYKSWLEAYRPLSNYNEQAAEAFSRYGVTSDQAASAGEKWLAQANKADELARQAGLDSCVVSQSPAN